MVFDGTVSACIPKAVCNREMPVAAGGAGNGDAGNKLTEEGNYRVSTCVINLHVSLWKIVVFSVLSFFLLLLRLLFVSICD